MRSRDLEAKRQTVRTFRERRRAAGRVLVSTDLPGDLVELIDQAKEESGLRGRTPIIEEAVRFYFEQKQRA